MPKRKPSSEALPWHGLVDADDRVKTDLLCLKCASGLRGQPITGHCPNCGHPVSDSAHGDYLVHSDRDMVRRLADAARFVMYGAILLVSMVGVGFLTTLVSCRTFPDAVNRAFEILLVGGMISPVVAAVGLVVLTPRGSVEYYEARYLNLRAILKLAAWFVPALAALIVASTYLGPLVARTVQIVWIFVPLYAFLRGVEQLMRRVPNAKLAQSARMHNTALVFIAVGGLAVLLIQLYARDDPDWAGGLIAITLVCTIAAIAFTIRGIRLLTHVQRALYQAAR
jgi:hypothetical protein